MRTLKALGYIVSIRPFRVAYDLILWAYQESIHEWGGVISHVAALAHTARTIVKPPQIVPPKLKKEDYIRVANELQDYGPTSGAFKCASGDCDIALPDAADLNRCSWCGTCSAMLRKCARCKGVL